MDSWREICSVPRLNGVIGGRHEPGIFPFLWMDGSPWELVLRQIEKIYECGLRAFCVESRTFEDFCGDSWWRVMGTVLAEADRRGMRVWILDDKHFPTGYANGLIGSRYPERGTRHLVERHVDIIGPRKNVSLRALPFLEDDELVVAAMLGRDTKEETLSGEPADLTARVKDGYLRLDVPEGCHRVFFVWKSREGVDMHRRDYIHMLDERSVDVLIEAVYDSHYAHFSKYFGNTLAGFFSDEPCFSNGYFTWGQKDGGFYDRLPGMPGLALPWRDRVLEMMGVEAALLPALWYGAGGRTREVRAAYMDSVTALYRDCFSMRLGEWCRAHGVIYTGHIIEDMGAHARLGYGAGHFFRAQAGQDIAGVDVVLHQVLPGFAHSDAASSCAGLVADADFFHYTLAKLGSSMAHITPRMRGRTMCEVFGAYGWALSAPVMKWLIDFMLVRGVNQFVPHAFSPVFPNTDSPPHFDADGQNPQFEDFKLLMEYTERAARLLSGEAVIRVAILYHAEAEWSGARYMPCDRVGRELFDAQIDYEIIPADALAHAGVERGNILVGPARYSALIVPGAEFLPGKVLGDLNRLRAGGHRVIFADYAPEGCESFEVAPVGELPSLLGGAGLNDVELDPPFPLIRVRQVECGDSNVFMLFNESAVDTFAGRVRLAGGRGSCQRVDLITCEVADIHDEGGYILLELAPYQSTMLVFSGEGRANGAVGDSPAPKWRAPELEWDIDIAESGDMARFSPHARRAELSDLSESLPRFAGAIRYRADWVVENPEGISAISLGEVGDTAELSINGRPLGRRICPPYRYSVPDGALRAGVNEVEVTAYTTLARRMDDELSAVLPMAAMGLQGPLEYCRAEG